MDCAPIPRHDPWDCHICDKTTPTDRQSYGILGVIVFEMQYYADGLHGFLIFAEHWRVKLKRKQRIQIVQISLEMSEELKQPQATMELYIRGL